MSSRKHTANRWYRSSKRTGHNSDLVLRCNAPDCDYEPVDVAAKEQERLFREHRRAMGEQVADERPSPLEKARERIAELESENQRLREQVEQYRVHSERLAMGYYQWDARSVRWLLGLFGKREL